MRTLHSIDYHRNGVGGVGFYVCIFSDDEADPHERFVGIQFADDTNYHTAMLGIGRLCEDQSIKFGENSWRGDHIHAWMQEQRAIYDAAVSERLERQGKEPHHGS